MSTALKNLGNPNTISTLNDPNVLAPGENIQSKDDGIIITPYELAKAEQRKRYAKLHQLHAKKHKRIPQTKILFGEFRKRLNVNANEFMERDNRGTIVFITKDDGTMDWAASVTQSNEKEKAYRLKQHANIKTHADTIIVKDILIESVDDIKPHITTVKEPNMVRIPLNIKIKPAILPQEQFTIPTTATLPN